MDIVSIRNAIETLAPVLTPGQMTSLETYIGQGLARYHEDKKETRIANDLKELGIQLLDDNMIDENLYMDESPF